MARRLDYLLGFTAGMQFVLFALERQARAWPRNLRDQLEVWMRSYHEKAGEIRRRTSQPGDAAAELILPEGVEPPPAD